MRQTRESSNDRRWRVLMEKATLLFEKCNYSSYDAMIVVPPGSTLEHPAIGPHLLASRAQQAGFRVAVLYANMIYAAIAGEAEHQTLCGTSEQIWGERVFARAAYGSPLLGRKPVSKTSTTSRFKIHAQPDDWPKFRKLATIAGQWTQHLSRLLAKCAPPVIGCTSMFQQNAASLALLKQIKRLSPDRIAIMGGPNCNGEMAEGIIKLCDELDFVFSGEADEVFPEFLEAARSTRLPNRGVIYGSPLLDMDTSPPPSYTEFYEQLDLFLHDSQIEREGRISLPYESSRGCWWGEKHHCTFCGLNATGMVYRAKSPDRVISDLRKLLDEHPNRRVNMVDNIMPHQYFKTLLPRLGEALPNLQVFYEQKSNLTLEKVVALQHAGVSLVQPGIESLSTPLLKRMKKGVTARQNIDLLRYCRSVGITLVWNILYGFPGDSAFEYASMLGFLPKLQHLNPPAGVFSVCIDRFSPYFERPEEFGVSNLRPADVYSTFLPKHADTGKLASQFQADFESESIQNDSIPTNLWQQVMAWHEPWQQAQPPILELTELNDDTYLLVDTRRLPDTTKISFLNRSQASFVLTGGGLHLTASEIDHAIAHNWVINVDDSLQPLATCAPGLLATFEAEVHPKPTRGNLPKLPIRDSHFPSHSNPAPIP